MRIFSNLCQDELRDSFNESQYSRHSTDVREKLEQLKDMDTILALLIESKGRYVLTDLLEP